MSKTVWIILGVVAVAIVLYIFRDKIFGSGSMISDQQRAAYEAAIEQEMLVIEGSPDWLANILPDGAITDAQRDAIIRSNAIWQLKHDGLLPQNYI